MRLKELKAQLKAFGTAQNRKVYQRHGYGPDTYGVSFANLGALKKKIKTDHSLAQDLWIKGNDDERLLATMIADPEVATEAEIDAWAKDVSVYVLADLFATYVGKTKFAKKKAVLFSKSSSDWVSRAGWDLYAGLALRDEELPDDFFLKLTDRIEKQIHRAGNYTRHAMNNALIAIGVRNAALRTHAVSAARRIGEVVVDHGETGCKTPDAEGYIERTLAHRKKKAKKAAAKKPAIRATKKRAAGKPAANGATKKATEKKSSRAAASKKKTSPRTHRKASRRTNKPS